MKIKQGNYVYSIEYDVAQNDPLCNVKLCYIVKKINITTKQIEKLYINNDIKKLIEIHLTTKLKYCNGVLNIDEYGPYIFAASNQNCNVFLNGVPITDRTIEVYKQEFLKNDSLNKKFFAIMVHSDGQNPHVSTLIVDCSKEPNELYLFDTSENVHQRNDHTNARKNIINTEKQIYCLNTLPLLSLQKGDCCTTWNAIFNANLVSCNSIEEIIDIQNKCLKISFFQKVVGNIKYINPNFIDEANCNALLNRLNYNLPIQQIKEDITQQQEIPATQKQKNKTGTKLDPNILRKSERIEDIDISQSQPSWIKPFKHCSIDDNIIRTKSKQPLFNINNVKPKSHEI